MGGTEIEWYYLTVTIDLFLPMNGYHNKVQGMMSDRRVFSRSPPFSASAFSARAFEISNS